MYEEKVWVQLAKPTLLYVTRISVAFQVAAGREQAIQEGTGGRGKDIIYRVGFFKNEANVSDFVLGQTKHSKKPVASFVTSFRFRLCFIGYPFVLKQVENEEKMSCMFLLIFHGQTKSETFASFLKNLTLGSHSIQIAKSS